MFPLSLLPTNPSQASLPSIAPSQLQVLCVLFIIYRILTVLSIPAQLWSCPLRMGNLPVGIPTKKSNCLLSYQPSAVNSSYTRDWAFGVALHSMQECLTGLILCKSCADDHAVSACENYTNTIEVLPFNSII